MTDATSEINNETNVQNTSVEEAQENQAVQDIVEDAIVNMVADNLPGLINQAAEELIPAATDATVDAAATASNAVDTKLSGCCGLESSDLREQIKAIRSYPIFRYFAWFNHENEKVAVIFANSYFYYKSIALGDGAINDGLLMREKLLELGYRVFVYYDCLAFSFRRLIKNFMKCHAKTLLVYFSGHGIGIPDVLDKDEDDEQDEALVFYDGWVSDDYIGDCIAVRNVGKLIMIADCCHSGTIFDVKERDTNIVTMSACADFEEATQAEVSENGNGVFTYYLWQHLPECHTYAELQEKINQDLQQYNHQCIIKAQEVSEDELI